MIGSKVKLEFIANDSARKATFKLRKGGLFKKVKELTTLCGVEACAIIYSPYDTKPEVWPRPSGADRVIERTTNLSGDGKGKWTLDQESYLKQRILKVRQKLEKLRIQNKDKEITKLMYDFLGGQRSIKGLTFEDTLDLYHVIKRITKEVARRIEFLQKDVE